MYAPTLLSPEIGTTRPYAPTGMNTAAWERIPPEYVLWSNLITTQDECDISSLMSGAHRDGSDTYPEVVEHCGDYYLEDGHHRVVREVILGNLGGMARVLRRP